MDIRDNTQANLLFNWRVRTDTCDRLDWFAHKLNTKITGKVKKASHQTQFHARLLCFYILFLLLLILVAQCPASSSSSSASTAVWIVRWFLCAFRIIMVWGCEYMWVSVSMSLCVCEASLQCTANNFILYIHICVSVYTFTCTRAQTHSKTYNIYFKLLTNTHSRHWNE